MSVKTFSRYLFFLPYIGAAFAVGALFAPAVSYVIKTIYEPSHALWIWGLYSEITCLNPGAWRCMGTYSMSTDLPVSIIGIIISIIIAYLGIRSVFKARRYGQEEKYIDNIFIKYGVIILICITIWVIFAEIYYFFNGFRDFEAPFSFWSYFPPHFGIIGVYVGGFIILIGPIIHKILYKVYYYMYV